MDWNIHCAISGSGPPIVLYPGLGASWEWWYPTIDFLADFYTLHVVDLPGSGESDPLRSQPSEEDLARFTGELFDSLSIQSAALIGHSLGGYVAIQAAIQGEARIERLSLIAPAGVTHVHNRLFKLLSAPLIGEVLQAKLTRLGLKVTLRSLVFNPESITDEVLDWGFSSLSNFRKRQQFLFQLRLASKIQPISEAIRANGPISRTLPIMIAWGMHDPIFPVEAAFQLQDLLRCPSPLIFDRSGHIPQIEESQAYNAALRAFLTENE